MIAHRVLESRTATFTTLLCMVAGCLCPPNYVSAQEIQTAQENRSAIKRPTAIESLLSQQNPIGEAAPIRWVNMATSKRFTTEAISAEQASGLVQSPIRWSIQSAFGNAPPVIHEDSVLLLDRSNRKTERIRCFDRDTGTIRWQSAYAAELPDFFDDEFGIGPHATPRVHQDRVFTIGSTGILTATDLSDGSVLWRRELWSEDEATKLERGYAASPVILHDRLILPLGGTQSGLICLSTSSGELLWQSSDEPISYTSPKLCFSDDGYEVIYLFENAIGIFDSSNGRKKCLVPFATQNSVHVCSPLILDKDQLLVGSSGGTSLFSLNKSESNKTASLIWESNRCRPQVGAFLVTSNLIIAPATGGASALTVILSRPTGELVSKIRVGGRGFYMPLRDGFLTLNSDGDLAICKLDIDANQPSITPILNERGFVDGPNWTSPTFDEKAIVYRNGTRIEYHGR